jgi:hypothetical protein
MSTQGEYTKSKRDLERRQNFKMSQPSDPNPALRPSATTPVRPVTSWGRPL